MSADNIKNAIAAVLALGVTYTGSTALADTKSTQTMMEMSANLPGMEKCYGIVKKGMNDCGTALHNCSGEAKQDNAKDEWIHMPTGLCSKIVGGSTSSGK
jgi:uncharacterized membrane protein